MPEQDVYSTDRVVVKFRSGGHPFAYLATTLQQDYPGLKMLRPPSVTGRVVFLAPAEANVHSLARQLALRSDVEWAEPDVITRATLKTPNDSHYQQQWGLPKINLPAYWNLSQGDNDLLIGIIDSGISLDYYGTLDHEDLNDAVRYILGNNYIDPTQKPRDDHGHGTHVTGIAAAKTDNGIGIAGVNWVSRVYITKVFDNNGIGLAADVADAIEETILYAIHHELKTVINYSGESRVSSNSFLDACKYVSDNGMVLCAAAGNDSGGCVGYPAAYSSLFPEAVIAVGAVDQNDAIADFSNVGRELTVIAPGVNIISTWPDYLSGHQKYKVWDGTSMATPFVTGLVSLIWCNNPAFSNREISNLLISHARKLGDCERSLNWGYGCIFASLRATGRPATMAFFNTIVSKTEQHMFYRTEDANIYHVWFDGSYYWDQWTDGNLSIPLTAGEPATMVTDFQHIFYRDIASNICHVWFDGSLQWDQWAGGFNQAPPAAGDPVAVFIPNTQHIFYRDIARNIYHIRFDGSLQWDQWAGGFNQAPLAAGDPVVITCANVPHIFYRSIDGSIYHVYDDGLQWEVWSCKDITLTPEAVGEPVAIVTDNNVKHIFYRDEDGIINHIWSDGTFHCETWNDGTNLAPSAAGDPAAMVTDNNVKHIFYQDQYRIINHVYDSGDGVLHRETWNGGGSTQAPLSTSDLTTMIISELGQSDQQHIFYRGVDSNIYHIWFDGSFHWDQWSGGRQAVVPSP